MAAPRNDAHVHPATKARFYGLDLYSLAASIEAVIGYLERVDPAEARRARERYSCFDHVGREGQAYGYAVAYEAALPCENEVVAQLVDLRRKADAYLRRDGWVAEDELFFAEQNARVVRDAEEYYQQMYRAEVSSWNLRDRHMAGTLDALVQHLDRQFRHTKVVIWEHNSHVGDARATAMGDRGELNVGQLARQRYGNDAVLVGFTTYDGHVTAASNWGDDPSECTCDLRFPAATKRFCTKSARRIAGSPRLTTTFVTRCKPCAWSARSVSSTGRVPSGRATTSKRALRTSSMLSFISITRARVEPLERAAFWDRGEPPRPTRRASDRYSALDRTDGDESRRVARCHHADPLPDHDE